MMNRETIFSPCRKYRYTLWREWSVQDYLDEALMGTNDGERNETAIRERAKAYVQFIGLNPSTADEKNDDPTIRRCIDFAKRWGFGALCMTNAFAWRDKDPERMKVENQPISEELFPWRDGLYTNDYWLRKIADGAGLVIAAWGQDGTHLDRDKRVLSLIPNIHCLGVNKSDGTPKHPLYLSADTLPIPYP